MEFRTRVDIKKSKNEISHGQKILLLGSCFSDNIGEKLVNGGFSATVNPLGTLYNPASIASVITECAKPAGQRNGEFFDWLHSKADLSWAETPDSLSTDILCITFGTAWIYRLKETGMVVANCKKQPDRLFVREKLSVNAIVDTWSQLIENWPDGECPRMIFTVSPIRHKKDGLHENQVSKATLLLAVNELCKRYPEKCEYFPAFEIMMDELRDYRFYAEDMMHPSAVAVDYIWEQFQETYFSEQTRQITLNKEKIHKQEQHIPFATQNSQ